MLIVFSGGSLFPETVEKEDLVLEHAGRMNRRLEDGRIILYLVEDVKWRKGETVISSDTASYVEDLGWLRLTGHVSVTEPERTILADTVDYYEEDDKAEARGEVTVISEDSKQKLQTNRLIYMREKDHMTAFNRPMITVRREEEEGDSTSLVIWGNRVVSCGEDSLFVVGDVIMEGDSLGAECDSSFYDLEKDWIRLRNNPVVTVTQHIAWGDEVDLYIPDEKIEQAAVRGSARAEGRKELKEEEETTGEERFWTEADSLVLLFKDEELSELTAYSKARSLVEREDEDKKVERNYVTGNVITVKMEEGEVERVLVEGDGRGVYVMPPDTIKAGAGSDR
ncbi:MAG: hypothetical protein ACE5OP_02435 [Candidatus Glassbacteria bacterium]